MGSINSVTISGRLGQKPELRTTGSGDSVTSLRVAMDAGKDSTIWMSVTAWGKLAELCAQYLDKGSYVVCSGRLKDESYDNKEGVHIVRIGINAYTIDFGPKPKGDDAPRPSAPAQAVAAPQDDLPF